MILRSVYNTDPDITFISSDSVHMQSHQLRQPHMLLDARFSRKMRGGDRCRFELARHLLSGKTANLSILAYDYIAEFVDISRARNYINSPFTPNQHPRFDFFEHWTLPGIAKKQATQIYHATYNILPLRRCAEVQILTVLDMAVFDFPEGYSKKFGPYMRYLLGHGIRKAEHLICISEATRSRMEALFPGSAEKATVIPVGVGEEFISIGGRRLQQGFKEGHPLLDDSPYLLYVGNLEPKKNLPLLIDGFLKTKAKNAFPHKLAIVGEHLPNGPGSGLEASTLAALTNDVVFLGYQPDDVLFSLYENASLVAYPSLYEGFGMPVLEGVAAGIPTLTSNVSSLPEAGGGVAWMVDPGSADSIAMGVEHCLTNTGWRQKAMIAGVAHGKSMAWNQIAKTTGNLYEKLWEQHLQR